MMSAERYPQETNAYMRRRRVPGVGQRKSQLSRKICVQFTNDTFAEVRARALREKTSFAEAVRTLVEGAL